MGILPGLFLFKHPTTSSVSPHFSLLPPSDHRRFIMKASPYATSEDRCWRFSRYPWLLLCLSEEAKKGRGGPDATRILGSTWCLRSSADLFKGFDLSFRFLPQKTVARIRYWLLTKLLTYSADQLTNASRTFKYDVTVAGTVELSV